MEAQVEDGLAPKVDSAITDPPKRLLNANEITGDRPALTDLSAVPRNGLLTSGSKKPKNVMAALANASKPLATAAIAIIAALSALLVWDYYLTSPWTRDGRIRVQVASIAPQVAGQIKELMIADNQFVHKGEVLYVIDPFDFEVALRTSSAQLQQKAADLQVKELQSERRRHLTNLATTPEEQQVFAGNAVQAKAAFAVAEQQVSQAEINLNRTRVRSPVNGYVTNLLMRVGDYAHQGVANVSIIDTDSYWVDGYFEETKMVQVCIGDRAEAKLMGYSSPIVGHVNTVTRGVSVSDAGAGAQGLPNVDPVYTWVRLAQRVPVRVTIDNVPSGVPLVSGMTATVTIRPSANVPDQRLSIDGLLASLRRRLTEVFRGRSARPECIPAATSWHPPSASLPPEQPSGGRTPAQLNPGLAPSMTSSPQNK